MNKIKIAIASDHGGYILKGKIIDYLSKKNYELIDFGTDTQESCDYPVYAKKVVNTILNNKAQKGILICGTGIGMQITANRYRGIRAVCASDTFSAKMSREHNNSNILTLGERVVGYGLACDIVDIWLESEFLGGRHLKRINMIDE